MTLGSITSFVMGETLLVVNHSAIAAFSYVCPSAAMVGSIMTSKLQVRREWCNLTINPKLITVYDD